MTLEEKKEAERLTRYNNASRAMAAAHAMLPHLQGVARVVTGNPKLQIMFDGKGSRTDSKNKVWLTPPGDLGRFRTHKRTECSKYDDRGFSLCQACREEESLFATALHECSHVAFGSGATPSRLHLQEVSDIWLRRRAHHEFQAESSHDSVGAMVHFTDEEVEHWIKTWISANANMWQRFCDSNSIRDGYMSTASAVSSWLPPLLNAIEDSRVNRALHSHRPGTTRMFEASTQSIMEDGIVDLDGQPMHWKDREVDHQVLIGALLLTSGYEFDFRSCLVPEATEVFNDRHLRGQLDRVAKADGIAECFDISRSILKRLQELGYCKDPDPENGDEPGGEPGDGDGTGEPGGAGGGTGTPADRSAKEAFVIIKIVSGHEDEIERDVNELGEGDPINPDEVGKNIEVKPAWNGEDDDIDLASVHFDHFDEPPRGIAGVKEYRFSSGPHTGSMRKMMDRYGDTHHLWTIDDVEDIKWAAGQHLPKMRKIFSENKAVKTHRHLKAGRIDSASLGRKLKTGRDDVFRKRTTPTHRSYAVVIGMDISGSVASGWLKPIKAAALAQAEMLHRANIPFEFNCHTGNSNYTSSTAGLDLEIVKIKDWDEKWGPEQLKRLNAIVPASCNLDGHTFEYYRKSVESRQEDVGLILYFTDGSMPAENYTEELEVLQREVLHIKRRNNLEMLCIGVGNSEPAERYNLDMIRYDSIHDLPLLMAALEKKLTRR